MYKHNTAVQMREGDALNLALQREKNTSHRMALLTSQTPAPGGNRRQNGPALRQPLALLASCLAEISGLAHKLMALLGYNVTEEERESTFTSVSR